jgi:hypothetical protein
MIPSRSEKPYGDSRSLQVALGYAAITIFVLISYIVVVGRYEDFAAHVLPSGDPFTYTVGWFRVVDEARTHYLKTIVSIMGHHFGGWYRLMQMEIAVLAPILSKDPAVLCIINYLIWGFGTAAVFRLGIKIGLGTGRAFVVALIPWIWPVNYGFSDYTSMPVLGLDAAFTGALTLALANSFVFALDPRNRLNGLIAAASIGIAIWGRGNSAPVVALVVGWPCLLAVWNAVRIGDRRARFNVALAAAIAAAMTVEFYASYWPQLRGYYGQHADFFERHHWTLHDALPYLKNIPGFMYWRAEDSWVTEWLSWTSHLVPIFTLFTTWRDTAIASGRREAYRQFAIAGALIYFGTFAADLALWTDPQMTLFNALLIWRPMLIGLSLSVTVLFLRLTDAAQTSRESWLPLPVGAAFLVWGALWSAHNTPWSWGVGRPSPAVVERFALAIDPMLEGSGPLSMLWYGSWNPAILQYYRAKDDYPPLTFYRGQYADKIWDQSDYSEENRAHTLEEIKANFRKAGLIIIPEYLSDYSSVDPYAFYHFKKDWANWLNSADAPRLRVIMIMQNSPTIRLLVLQREDLAHGRGDPFRVPWGDRPTTPPPDYSDAVARFK